ncbi:MAG TPA: NAD(P)/FAD-dependent oxidoreductase [Polyangiaceae bacterium]|nr:NAD(P)/FAD-dependent oxidoreductase [Polyangiaceae bacterium]
MSQVDSSELVKKKKSPGSANRRRAHGVVADRVDVAIIGSGLGGLVAAGYLAQQGLSVSVFESHYTAGGCATQFSRGPKSARWNFDVGLHYVGDCEQGMIPRILRDLASDVGWNELDPGGFDTLVFPDFRFRIPANLELYRERLVEAFPHERRGIDRYVRLVRGVMKVARLMETYEGRRPPLVELAKVALDAVHLVHRQNATIGEVLKGMVRDPKLVAVLLGQSGDYGLPPSQVSALLHMGLAGHYFRGAYYPRGGGQILADKLAARVEALGGSIHLRTPVERVLVEGGRAVGVRLPARSGEPPREIRADVVLSNADLKRTLCELVGPEHLPSGVVTKARDYKMAAALFMTFVGLEGDGRDVGLSNSNIWQFDGYDVEGFYRDGDKGHGPIGVTGCYITSGSMKDPDNLLHHAPAGHTGVEVMAVVPSSPKRWGAEGDVYAWDYEHGDTYLQRKREVEDGLIDRLDNLFPGSKARVVLRESATPMTHGRFTGATDGTGYGLACTPDQFMKSRPGYRGPLPGLYLTGASTRAGHGIVGAMMGGRAAATRILRDVAAGKVALRSSRVVAP